MATKADARPRRLPAEWEPQSGVLITWPRRDSDWSAMHGPVDHVFAHIACEISRRETVLIVAQDDAHQAYIRALITTAGGNMRYVSIVIAATNDAWARDHGPITIQTQNGPQLLDFTFNGWGNKYPSEQDNQLTSALTALHCFHDLPTKPVDMVLEGGSIDCDGNGTLLTTSRCLLHPGRNPTLSRHDIEKQLQHWLGVKRILWLEHGALAGDDTDSHIDTLARFVSANTLVYQSCDDDSNPNYAELKAMQQELEMLDAQCQLIPLPSPEPIHNVQGQPLPASYANFLIINDAVLVPAYDDPADEPARATIAACFPNRETVSIDCLPLIHQYGSLHCVTMQLPEGILNA